MWFSYQSFILIAILLISFGIRWYFQKFTEELGKQTAELIIIKQRTFEAEAVKRLFNEKLELFKKDIQLDLVREVEPLRASLSKENIAYQIYTAEYIKMRFQRLDELYARLYKLERHLLELFDFSKEYNQQELAERHGKLYYEFYKPADDAFAKAFIYIEDDVADSVKKLLNENKEAFNFAARWYTSRHVAKDDKTDASKEKYYKLDDERREVIGRMNLMLKEVEEKFKRNLTVI